MRGGPGSQLAFLQNYRFRGAGWETGPRERGDPLRKQQRAQGVTATRPIQSHLRQNLTPNPVGDTKAAGTKSSQHARVPTAARDTGSRTGTSAVAVMWVDAQSEGTSPHCLWEQAPRDRSGLSPIPAAALLPQAVPAAAATGRGQARCLQASGGVSRDLGRVQTRGHVKPSEAQGQG